MKKIILVLFICLMMVGTSVAVSQEYVDIYNSIQQPQENWFSSFFGSLFAFTSTTSTSIINSPDYTVREVYGSYTKLASTTSGVVGNQCKLGEYVTVTDVTKGQILFTKSWLSAGDSLYLNDYPESKGRTFDYYYTCWTKLVTTSCSYNGVNIPLNQKLCSMKNVYSCSSTGLSVSTNTCPYGCSSEMVLGNYGCKAQTQIDCWKCSNKQIVVDKFLTCTGDWSIRTTSNPSSAVVNECTNPTIQPPVVTPPTPIVTQPPIVTTGCTNPTDTESSNICKDSKVQVCTSGQWVTEKTCTDGCSSTDINDAVCKTGAIQTNPAPVSEVTCYWCDGQTPVNEKFTTCVKGLSTTPVQCTTTTKACFKCVDKVLTVNVRGSCNADESETPDSCKTEKICYECTSGKQHLVYDRETCDGVNNFDTPQKCEVTHVSWWSNFLNWMKDLFTN